MAHTMTIRTQQTVTTTGSTIIVNTGHLKTWNGLLKLLQVVCILYLFIQMSFSLTMLIH